MMSRYSRTEMLLGESSTEKLKNAKVIVFGVGGVGSYTVEALSRAGIGTIAVVDNDEVAESNINRQLIATAQNVGQDKVQAAKERILSISPDCNVIALKKFLTPENIDVFDLESYDYIVDAIDTVTSKIALAVYAEKHAVPLISSMGTGNKLDPTCFEVADIFKTSVCPLARVMRYELKKRGVKHLKVVYSKEEPIKNDEYRRSASVEGKKCPPGSAPFVPPVAGMIMAGEVIKDIVKVR